MVETIEWTAHAGRRLAQRGLARAEVEAALRTGHRRRELNRGDADWRVRGTRADCREFVVLYDHPVNGDRSRARIVSVWPVRRKRGSND